ncbi:MAG: type II toxin-antitoxin system VapC family toxin [Rhizobiaceae bacterium]|nr:type II toxin-antitoxin system VapC family toxin [Rhizobiaceae bacterium]
MSVVIDNSVALAWVLTDERGDVADRLLDNLMHEGGHVPFTFRAEFANGLTVAVRRNRIDRESRTQALSFMEGLKLVHDIDGRERMRSAVDLADAHGLTVYDAIYLDLAQQRRLPLATFDRQLAAATREAGVALVIP